MAAILKPAVDAIAGWSMAGQAIVSNETLNDLIESADECESPIADELTQYASLGVPIIVPISTLVRWQHFASGK